MKYLALLTLAALHVYSVAFPHVGKSEAAARNTLTQDDVDLREKQKHRPPPPELQQRLRRRRRSLFSWEAEKEFHWSNGTGRITLRNPQPGLFQQFGNGLNDFTKGMANNLGFFGGGGKNQNMGNGKATATASSGGGLFGNLGNLGDLRNVMKQVEQRIRASLPVIPRFNIPDPLSFVPNSLKDMVRGFQAKLGEISAAIRNTISNVCRTHNCKQQTDLAFRMKNTLKEKLLTFQKGFFGNGDEKALGEQFERVQQVKKALLARANLDKEVEPADDGVYDSDVLLTSKQSELLLNELGQGGQKDVISNPPTAKARRAAIFFENQFFQKWDVSSPIPYVMDDSLAAWDKTDVRDALKDISAKTCIRFAEQRARPQGYHIYYVKIDQGSFCGLSYIGRTAPANPVYLSFACGETKGIVIHETLHALGLAHEHVRVDRDEHIKVDWSNINPQYYDAFAISDPKTFSTYGVKYDYGSIMHYRSNSAALNPSKPTMIPKVNEAANLPLLGQRRGLSVNDVEMLNRLYCKPANCVDQNVYCGAWAIQGVCTRSANNIWMQQNCRKSCGLC